MIFFLLLLLLITPSLAAVTFNGETQITNGPADSVSPSFYISDNGTVELTWQEGTNVFEKSLTQNLDDQTSGSLLKENAANPVSSIYGTAKAAAWQFLNGAVFSIEAIVKGIYPAGIISNESFDSTNPKLAGGTALNSVWQVLKKGIFYRTFADGRWEDMRNVSTSNKAINPVISATDSNLYFAYQNLADVTFRLYKGNQRTGYGTDELDSDGDGLVDAVEMGYANSTNSSYWDVDPATKTNQNDFDSDNDGLPDGWVDGWFYDERNRTWTWNISEIDGLVQIWEGEDWGLNGKIDGGESDPNKADTDGDGLPDGWEIWNGLDATSSVGNYGASGDLDLDGVTNLQELGNGKKTLANDSDGDGLWDGTFRRLANGTVIPIGESILGTLGSNPDTDGDGLSDLTEYTIGTLLNNPDTDGDGVKDGAENYESMMFTDNCGPDVDCDSDGLINAKDSDSDGDGIGDSIEYRNGTDRISPVKFDTDDDGRQDSFEDANMNGLLDAGETDPTNPDSDGDGLWDGSITMLGNWTIVSIGETTAGTNPLNPDWDNDGLSDFAEVYGWSILVGGKNYWTTSNPKSNHSDGDGFSDSDEKKLYGTNPSSADTDGDLISDWDEINTQHTDPLNPDTDGDGVYDGVEPAKGTNMTNPDTDGDGLPDSEGDWIEFRTDADDVNGGRIIREELLSGSAYRLAYRVSSIINVTSYSSGFSYTNQTNNPVYPPSPGQYWWIKQGMNGLVVLGTNLTAQESVTVYYYSAFMGGSYSWGFTGPGTNFSIYEMDYPYYVTVRSPANITAVLTETSGTPGNGQYRREVRKDNSTELFTNTSGSERLVVYYYGASDIDYSAPENDNSWIAVDIGASISKNLVPFGRIKGLALTDTQIGTFSNYVGVATSPEGYEAAYAKQPVLNGIIKYSSLNHIMEKVAWNPSGEYAIGLEHIDDIFCWVGDGYLVYPDNRLESLTIPGSYCIKGAAWSPSGDRAILVGNVGTVLKYNATTKNVSIVSSGVTANLSSVEFPSYGDVAVIVGDGKILRYDAASGIVSDITRPSGLGGPGYSYTDVSYIDNVYVLITTSTGKAFVFQYNAGFESWQFNLTLSPAPTKITSADWKRSTDSRNNKQIDAGLMLGTAAGNEKYLYKCYWNGTCLSYKIPCIWSCLGDAKDVEWNPRTGEALIVTDDDGPNSNGKAIIFDSAENNFTSKIPSTSSRLFGISWHPSGDYAFVAARAYNALGTSTHSIFSYIPPYVAMDVPGDKNPVYGSPTTFSLASDAYYAETGHGTVPAYNSAGKETGNLLMVSDPLKKDSLNDGLSDGARVALGYNDADHNGIPNFLDKDADGDGILNGEEASFDKDADGDKLLNVFDTDSDNDTSTDWTEARVVFRTNAAYNSTTGTFNYWAAGTGIAVQRSLTNSSAALIGYVLAIPNANLTAAQLPLNYTLLGRNVQVDTPEGYPVYDNGTHILVRTGGNNYTVFRTGTFADLSANPISAYASNHKETYNMDLALTNPSNADTDKDGLLDKFEDVDNDGIVDAGETDRNAADTDGDGIIDGTERNWNQTTDDYDDFKNALDVDSDNDGLPDGWKDGWCFNSTKPGASGSIAGWGVWCATDGLMQAWEGENFARDGAPYWNTKYLSNGTVIAQSETNPLNFDSDSDGVWDGEEVAIYGTNPVGGKDSDNDGIWDKDELKGWFLADSAELGDYAPTIGDVLTYWNGFRDVKGVKLYGATSVNVTLTLNFGGMYRLNLTGLDTEGSIYFNISDGNGTTIAGNTYLVPEHRTFYEGYLPGGVYDITIGPNVPGFDYVEVHRILAYKQGLNYSNTDTDSDGIKDGAEEGWGRWIFTNREFPEEELSYSSPLDADSDDDGISDGEELAKGTNPIRSDSDGDGIIDTYDLLPNANLETSYPWSDVFRPGTLYYESKQYLWFLDGHSHRIDCGDWGLTSCNRNEVVELGENGVRNSPTDLASRTNTIEEGVNYGLDSWIYRVENTTDGVVFYEGGDRHYSISYTRDYFYYSNLDPYPTYKISYDLTGRAYTVMLGNGRDAYMVEGKGWVPTYEAASIGDPEMKYWYAEAPIKLEPGKNQHVTLQISVDPALDKSVSNDSENYLVPAIDYALYDGEFSWGTGVMSGISIGRTLEYVTTRHSYEFTINLPKEKIEKPGYVIYLSPIYINVTGGKISRIPMNARNIKAGALAKTTDDYSFSLVTNLSANVSAINSALPANIQTYPTGNATVGPYKLFVYNGAPENVTQFFNSTSLGGYSGVVLIGSSEADVSFTASSLNWSAVSPKWEFYYNDSLNNSLPSRNSIKETRRTTRFYSSFGALDMEPFAAASTTSNETFVTITKNNQTKYSVTRNDAKKTSTPDLETTIVRAITVTINDISTSEFLTDPRFNSIKAEITKFAPGTVATVTNAESIIVSSLITGNYKQVIIYKIANYLYDHKSAIADFGKFGWKMRTIKNTLQGASGGKVSFGIFQRSFLPPNVPGKFVHVGVTDAVMLGLDVAKMGYQIYTARTTEDPIMKKAAYEDVAATGIGIGFSVASIAFPPAAVIIPTWYATYYAIWAPLKLLNHYDIIDVEQGPFDHLAAGPEGIVFIFEFNTGIIPSAMSLDALKTAYADTDVYQERWFLPSQVVPAE
ncbi:MAG: hypothetical protein V1820_00250 [archaeon]